jgi:urease accessory protein
VGQALTFAALQLTGQDAFAVHQYGLASLMLGAALRLLKVNYLDVQAVLFEINGEAESAYQRVVDCSLDDMATWAPMFDVLAAIHVQSKIRLFMN